MVNGKDKNMFYDWIKALHVIAVISWMAGMLYLPRLYVYHTMAKPGSELSEALKLMERRLLRLIINPAMIASFVFGLWMLMLNPDLLRQPFMNVKLALVVLMVGVHGLLSRYRRAFASDKNRHSARFYRILNEAPTLLMVGIILMIIVRPSF
jgi:putative membrane protein